MRRSGGWYRPGGVLTCVAEAAAEQVAQAECRRRAGGIVAGAMSEVTAISKGSRPRLTRPGTAPGRRRGPRRQERRAAGSARGT
jgi:hypothetical protein